MGNLAVSGLIFIGAFTIGLVFWLVFVTDGTYLGKPAVRFLYQRFARVWNLDERHGRSRGAANSSLLPQLRAAIKQISQPQVLDLATGTGRVPLLIAAEPGFDGHVTGVDFSRNMLARGSAILRSKGFEDKVDLIEGDASALAMADDCFDLVTCIEAPLVNEKKVLKEALRVLKPGGTLIYSKHSDNWGRMLPGKSLNIKGIRRFLTGLAVGDVRVEAWQKSQDLVIARKAQRQVSTSTVRVGSLPQGG